AVDGGRPAAAVNVANDLVDPALEVARLLERADPDRAEQVSVLPRSRAVGQGAELGAVARPRQDGGEDSRDEREARALVAPDRLEQPPERGGRVGRRRSLGVERPA